MCHTVAIYRSMSRYTEARIRGTPAASRAPAVAVTGPALENLPYGWMTAQQQFNFTFVHHMYEYGTTSAQLPPVVDRRALLHEGHHRLASVLTPRRWLVGVVLC